MSEGKRTLSVRLDDETFRQLRVIAAERDKSMQVVAAEWIREKIEREKESK